MDGQSNDYIRASRERRQKRAERAHAAGAFQFLRPHAHMSFDERIQYVIAFSIVLIALVALGAAVYFARPILLPIATALVVSVLLAPAAEWLRKRSVPNGLRAFIVVAFAFLIFIGGFYLMLRPGAAWIENLPSVVSDAKEKLVGMREAVDRVQNVSEQVSELAEIGGGAQEVVVLEGPRLGDSLMASARTIIVQVIFATVLTYFFLSARMDLRQKLILLRSDFRGMRQTARVLTAIEEKVGAYMFTMLIINLTLGAATAAAMWAIGMPTPLVWGGLAAILNFIPYLGPIALTALLAISGVVNFETPATMLAPAGIYIVFNFIESNFVTPLLIGVRLTISPLAIILTISFWTWIWGPAGAVISVPFLVIFKTVCDHSTFLRPVGLLLGDAGTFRPVKS